MTTEIENLKLIDNTMVACILLAFATPNACAQGTVVEADIDVLPTFSPTGGNFGWGVAGLVDIDNPPDGTTGSFQEPTPATLSQPNVFDIVAVANKVKDVQIGAIPKAVAQLNGNDPEPDDRFNIFDLTLTVNAVKAMAYPFSGPNACQKKPTQNCAGIERTPP